MWRKSFKTICHFHKCTPNKIVYRFTDDPNEWCEYLTYITHKKIMKREIELPNLDTPLNINIENDIQISRPSIFEGELLKYIPK